MNIKEAITKLKNEICYVNFTFSDNSIIYVCTTLNPEILAGFGVVFIKDCFYDIVRKKYINFRYDAESIEVYTDIPEFREVDEFANRFI